MKEKEESEKKNDDTTNSLMSPEKPCFSSINNVKGASGQVSLSDAQNGTAAFGDNNSGKISPKNSARAISY